MTIKVISLNLWWGGNLFPAIIDFLRAQNADIVVLQEVHNGQGPGLKDRQRSMEALRAQLQYPHADFARSFLLREAEGNIPFGNAVLSKYPMKHYKPTFLVESTRDEYRDVPEQWPIFPRLLQHVGIETAAGEVHLFNMHGVWDLDGDSPSPARQAMIAKTLAAIQDKQNVILAGDTNANSGNPIWTDVEQRLTSVFGRSQVTTFNMRRKDNPGYATAAVDHMFVSPEIGVASKDCPDVDISDHRPLVVELEIP